jgi:Tfp pilus assembly protein PilO
MSQTSDGLRVNRLERLRKMRRSHRGTLGLAEIIGLGIAGLMLLAVIIAYLYLQAPAQSSGTALERERDQLKQKLRVSQEDFKRGVDVKVRVEEITGSLEKFEDHRLVTGDGGRIALYEELNQLIRKNSLRNTSGPAYTPLEPVGLRANGQVAAASSTTANKWQSIYPGIAVNVTVEGQYKDIRHFVRDLESSKEFVIVNAVELERATGSNSQLAAAEAEGGGSKSGPGNALVSLRLDLATYFSRPVQVSEKPVSGAAMVP